MIQYQKFVDETTTLGYVKDIVVKSETEKATFPIKFIFMFSELRSYALKYESSTDEETESEENKENKTKKPNYSIRKSFKLPKGVNIDDLIKYYQILVK